MASLPKPTPEPPFLSLEELEAIYGTPAYEEECQRQMRALVEHNRQIGYRDRVEPDGEWLDRVWT